MWWGTAGSLCGIRYGMLMVPLFFLIIIAILAYFFNRRDNTGENHQLRDHNGNDEILMGIHDMKKDVRELREKKEKEKE